MNDNALIKVLISRINASLAAAGLTEVQVLQKPQPEQEGVPSSRVVYFQKLFDRRFGTQSSKTTYDESAGDFAREEVQVMDVTFQISAIAAQTYDDTLPTASDLLNAVAMGLASRDSRHEYLQNGFNILRIVDVANPVFTDDRFQFEFMPTFDIVFVTARRYNSRVPKVDRYQGDAYEV